MVLVKELANLVSFGFTGKDQVDTQKIEFGPAIPLIDKRDICSRCGTEFEMMGDNCLVENFCPGCQAKFRVEQVLECRAKGTLPVYYNWWTPRGLWSI